MNSLKLQNTSVGLLAGAILLVVATSPLWTLAMVKHHARKIINDSLPGLSQSSLANVNISDGFVELSLALAKKDHAARENDLSQIESATKRTDALLEKYSASVMDPEERAYFERMVELRMRYRETRKQIIALMREDRDGEALDLFQNTALRQFSDYKQACNAMVEFNVNEATKRGTQIMRLCTYMLVFQGAMLIFFLIYAFFVPLLTLLEKIAVRRDFIRDV